MLIASSFAQIAIGGEEAIPKKQGRVLASLPPRRRDLEGAGDLAHIAAILTGNEQ